MDRDWLLRNLVRSLPRVTLARLNFDAVLLRSRRDEAPHAVCLPSGGLHYLGERGALGAGDHLQDFRALALGTGADGLSCGLGGLFAGTLLRGLGFPAPGYFPALSRDVFSTGTLLRGSILRATRAACAATWRTCRLFLRSSFVWVLFCACFAQHNGSLWSREKASLKWPNPERE